MAEKELFTDAHEYVQMGQVLLGVEKYQEATEMFDRALAEDPKNLEAYISKGIGHASLEQYDQARECFKRCIMIDKTFAEAYFQLGSIDFLEDHFREGLKNYNQAIALGYRSAGLYFNLALVYEERNEIDEAIRYYTKAASLDETVPDYVIRKATLQIVTKKYDEALQTLEKVRVLFPESFEGYHLTAAAYTLTGRYDEADEVLRGALEMFPDDKDILFDRMRVLVTKGDLEAAEAMLENAKDSQFTPAERKEILLNQAQIKGQQEKMDEANQMLLEALAIPEGEHLNSEIRYLLMISYLASGDYGHLREIAEQTDRSDTDDPYNLCGVYFEGAALKGLGEDYRAYFQDAVKYYRDISMKEPSRIDAYLFRAMCYKELDDYEKALESLDYMLLLEPDDAKLHFIKGSILKEQGKDMDASNQEYAEAKRLGLNKRFWEFAG